MLNLDSKEVRSLTSNNFEDSHARWSPDGHLIVFQREDTLSNRDIWLIRADGKNEQNLTNSPDFREQHPRFSPDGRAVIFDGNRDEKNLSGEFHNYEIYSIEISSKKITRLTTWERWDMYPSFSSDKSQIAWRRALSIPGTNDQNYEIFVKDLVTGEERNISNSDSYDSNPHWSPKGDWIVYSSNEGGSSNLFLSKPDGSRKIKITQAEGRSIAFGIPTFSFDGTKVIANRYIQDVTDIVIIDISAIR